MKKFLGILFSTIIIIFVPIHIVAQSKNELVIGVGTSSGTLTNAKGTHDPVTGNAGTNVKLVTLVDDKLKSDPYFSLDYYRNLTEVYISTRAFLLFLSVLARRKQIL